MRISSKEIFNDESHGLILLQTAGTTRLQIDNAGNTSFAGAISGISGVSATSATLTGTISIGGASDLVGFWGATPVAAYSTTATSAGFTAGTGTTAVSGSTFTGNTGTKAYSVSDVVRALKLAGILVS